MSSPDRPHLVPGPDHPIDIEPANTRVLVTTGEVALADTTAALRLQEASYPPVFYLPPDSINWDVLVPSESHTYCPFKGDASYYSVQTAEGLIADAVWTYPEPYPAVAAIAGYLAFYPDRVQVTSTG